MTLAHRTLSLVFLFSIASSVLGKTSAGRSRLPVFEETKAGDASRGIKLTRRLIFTLGGRQDIAKNDISNFDVGRIGNSYLFLLVEVLIVVTEEQGVLPASSRKAPYSPGVNRVDVIPDGLGIVGTRNERRVVRNTGIEPFPAESVLLDVDVLKAEDGVQSPAAWQSL